RLPVPADATGDEVAEVVEQLSVGARHVIAVPLAGRSQRFGVLAVLNDHRRLFEDDDVWLFGELGTYAGLLAERSRMLAVQERLNKARQQAVVTAARARQAKTDFLASLSHELRTPLNAIVGFTDLMSADDSETHDGDRLVPAEWIRHVRTSGDHLLNLINEVL